MDAQVVLLILALCVSFLSLYVAARVAWENAFRPAKIVGAFPHMVVWTMGSYKGDKPTGEVAARYLTPSFWLANVGARQALIEDLRIHFTTEAGRSFAAFPVSKVPLEAVESPSLFHEKNKLGLGGPFSGFCLPRAEVWKACFAFSTKPENFELLKGNVQAKVQVRHGGASRWSTVLKEQMAFGSHPYHLQGLHFGNAVAGSSINHVFSKSWEERRAEKSSN